MAKQKIKQTMANFKDKVAESASATKRKVKVWGESLQEAYAQGFSDGYTAHDNLPNVRGSHTAAKIGYGKGLSAKHKENKAAKRIARAKSARKTNKENVY